MDLSRLADRPILVLSPHLDDAAFSASALLELPTTTVWTVFAGLPEDTTPTDWDRRCGYEDAQQLLRDRRAEDARALEGVAWQQLDYRERAYASPAQRALDLADLTAKVSEWTSENPTGLVALPVGAGVTMPISLLERLRKRRPGVSVAASPDSGQDADPHPNQQRRSLAVGLKNMARRLLHADYLRRRRRAQRRGMLANEDHIQLTQVIAELLRRTDSDILLYEELPYLWSQSGQAAATEIEESLGRMAIRLIARPRLRDKHRRVMQYATQLRVMDPELRRLESESTLPPEEHYWLLPADVRSTHYPSRGETVENSVIIAVRNGAHVIGEQLEALATQIDPPSFEVIVVDNRSTDDLAAACEPYQARLTLSITDASARPGQSYARNVGALTATGKNLLFCDADDIVGERWVAAQAATLREGDAIGTGPLEVAMLNSEDARRVFVGGDGAATSITSFPTQGYLSTAWGGNFAIRRESYLRLGGLDNSFRGGDEDTDLSWRAQEAGLALIVNPDAVVHVRLRSHPGELFRQRRGYARARVLTVARSQGTARTVNGMSLRWAATEVIKLPVGWLRSRGSRLARMLFAQRAGSVVGNAEGQIKYRVFRRTPKRDLLPNR